MPLVCRCSNGGVSSAIRLLEMFKKDRESKQQKLISLLFCRLTVTDQGVG